MGRRKDKDTEETSDKETKKKEEIVTDEEKAKTKKRKDRKRSKEAADSKKSCEEKDNGSEDIDELSEQVHSANAWEEVDLGDDGRKNKFLRLMGASNTKEHSHQGRFVIGDTKKHHTRAGDNVNSKTNKDLEHEFELGVEHKDFTKRHCGLGFHGAGDTVSTTMTKVSTKFNSDGSIVKDSSTDSKKDEVAIESKKKTYTMNFVKGSS